MAVVFDVRLGRLSGVMGGVVEMTLGGVRVMGG
jgi:hypothetical protein